MQSAQRKLRRICDHFKQSRRRACGSAAPLFPILQRPNAHLKGCGKFSLGQICLFPYALHIQRVQGKYSSRGLFAFANSFRFFEAGFQLGK